MARGAVVGTQATCRHCGRKVVYGRHPQDTPDNKNHWRRSGNPYWFHVDKQTIYCNFDDDDQAYELNWSERGEEAKPQEYCVHKKNDGAICLRPVQPEDMAAGLFACGIHMKNEVADQERIKAMQRSFEEAEEARAIAAWERSVYHDSAEWLRENLGPEMFEGYDAGRQLGGRYVERFVKIDVNQLKEAIVDLLERARSEGT